MITDCYRRDVLRGKHLDTDTYKMAVYDADARLDAKTLAYTTDHEVKGEGYPAGGVKLTGFIAQLFGGIATLDWDNPVIDPATITGRQIMIYNDSLPGKDAVYIGDLKRDISSTNGPWTPGFPPPGATTSLIQW